MLTIDSAIEFASSGEGTREFCDAATKTANTRTVTLDADTVAAIGALRREREPYGPWMFGLGPELVSPDRIGWWWKRARHIAGIDEKWRLYDLRHWSATVAIGQGHGRWPTRSRRPGDDAPRLRPRFRRRRPGRRSRSRRPAQGAPHGASE